MALGQVLAGNIIFADDIQDELDDLEARLPIRAKANVAKTFVSNTTFADITGLTVPVAANSVYKLRGRLQVTGANTTHDMKAQWSLPAGASVAWSCYGMTTSQTANPVSVDMGSSTSTHARGTLAGTLTFVLEGFITTGANAGDAVLQGAQNTSDAGTLSFDAGSEISLQLWV
jgi:hypothetical protein